MSGYDAAAWADFAVAVAGASAALSGLLFVAVSINVERIIALPALPARAAQTLILLTVPLIVCVFVLVPATSDLVLGTELAAVGLSAGGALVRLNRPAARSAAETVAGWAATRAVPALTVLLGLLAAGVTLVGGSGGGLQWIAPVVIVAFIGGLGNAWVLLVEILR